MDVSTFRPPHAPPADRWLTDPVESGPAAGFGVYLHVPFCAHRCGYCDFATYDDQGHLMDRYVAALREDIRRTVGAGPGAVTGGTRGEVAGGVTGPGPGGVTDDVSGGATGGVSGGAAGDGTGAGDWPEVTSVFVGGGTPTLLPVDDLASIVRTVHAELPVAPGAEITVECNPETASLELFGVLVEAGVTRISMGAQSFAPHVLATLERRHTPERPLEAVAQARSAGVPEVNLDLIYGTPGERDEDWVASLEQVVAIGTDHVSAYALTIHDNTPFGAAVREGRMVLPDEDVQRDRFEVADAILGAAGFEHYEVSNWARGPARRSDHNVLYWRHGDYLGLGVGAHGHLQGRRWWSHRSIPRYLAAVEEGRSPVAATERLDEEERALERLMLGLRLREGLHPVDAPPIDPLALEDAMAAGLVTTACGRLQATEPGWYLLDEAVSRLR